MNVDSRQHLVGQVRVMQIIIFALAMGVVTFALVILLFIRPEPADDDQLLSYIATGSAALAVPIGVLVPRIVASLQPVTLETYQTKMIIGASIFDGAAFFNLTVYMFEGQVYSLATAGVMLLFILLLFPTVNGVQEWIEAGERRRKESEALSH